MKHHMLATLFALASLVAMSHMSNAAINTYYVSPGGDDSNDGKSWAKAFATPNKGFSTINVEANRGSTLIIDSGTYALSEAIGCNGGASESKRSFVRSRTGNPEDVVLYSDGTFECLRLGNYITVSGITVSNGVNKVNGCASGGIRFGNYNDETYRIIVSNCVVTCCNNQYSSEQGNGAAVALYGHNLLIDSVIRDNTASSSHGAGVLIVNNRDYKGIPRIERCRIEGNTANSNGGGIYITNSDTNTKHQSDGNAVEVIDCEIIGNSAANGAGVYFATTNMTANFIGCIISNNVATSNSGGIRMENGANMVMRDCRVEDNSAGNGAGADVIGKNTNSVAPETTLTCSNTVFRGNIARGTGGGIRIIYNHALAIFKDSAFVENTSYNRGGGVVIDYQGKGFFDGCRFDANWTTSEAMSDNNGGGGIFLGSQTSDKKAYCAVSNCVFASNISASRAGGMGHTWQTNAFCAAVVNCIFTNNQSRIQGGGLVIRENKVNTTPAIVRNCLFAFNRTTANGGAADATDANGGGVLFVTYSDVTLENCTIVSNSVGNTKLNVSGGIHHRWGGKLKNCIVAFNTVNGVSDADKKSSSNTSWTLNDAAYENCCGWPEVTRFKTANGCIADDPKFVDPAHGDFSLQASSPCCNAGANADWMAEAKDLLGANRIVGDYVDIGCFEYSPIPGLMIILR